MKLYELTEAYKNVEAMFADPDADIEAIQGTLEAIDEEIEQKIDALASIFKDLTSDAAALDEESKRLKARSDSKKKRADWIRNYITNQMASIGKTKLETTHNSVIVPKGRASVDVDESFVEWAMTNAEQYLRYKDPEVDKKQLLDDLKNGVIVDHAYLKYTTNAQIK